MSDETVKPGAGMQGTQNDPVDKSVPATVPSATNWDGPDDDDAGAEVGDNTPYENPEFLTPKELSSMVAGFGVQIYVAMRARDENYSHRQAVGEAVSIVSIAVEDSSIEKIFAEQTAKLGLTRDVLKESRRRLKEAMELAALAAAAGE